MKIGSIWSSLSEYHFRFSFMKSILNTLTFGKVVKPASVWFLVPSFNEKVAF